MKTPPSAIITVFGRLRAVLETICPKVRPGDSKSYAAKKNAIRATTWAVAALIAVPALVTAAAGTKQGYPISFVIPLLVTATLYTVLSLFGSYHSVSYALAGINKAEGPGVEGSERVFSSWPAE